MQNTLVRPCKCCQHLHLRSDNSRNIVVSKNNRFCLRDVIEGFDMSLVRVWNEKKSGTLNDIYRSERAFSPVSKKMFASDRQFCFDGPRSVTVSGAFEVAIILRYFCLILVELFGPVWMITKELSGTVKIAIISRNRNF